MADLTAAELAAVAGVMATADVPTTGELHAKLLTAGRSNLTYKLWDDADAAWVMRTPPRVGRTPSAHDVAREYRVTKGLATAGVPVPQAVLAHDDEQLIGVPFAIAGFVEGATVQSRAQFEALGPELRASSLEALFGALAALHRVDHVAAGLERFGRPDGYAARQTKRWAGQWEIVGEAFPDAVRADAQRLAVGLADRLPTLEQRSTGVVHGDYRIDNTLLRLDAEAGTAEVAAIVDWELSTIGDPVADVAMMCVYRHPVFDLTLGGSSAWASDLMPDVDALAAGYERHGGVPLDSWEFHLALGYFKIAVIAAGIDHRHRAGASHGEGFDTAGESVGPFLAEGLALLG